MPFKNTITIYGAVSKSIHWITALAVIGLLAVGLYMSDLESSPFKFQLYGWHKSLGICVLAVTFLRILWHFYSAVPPLLATLKKRDRIAAKTVHYFLYAAIIGMPLSGWMMSSAANYPVSVFGFFTLPDLIRPDDALRGILRNVHEYLGYALMGAVSAHLGAALLHHFYYKDITLKRMLPIILALVFLFSSSALALVAPPMAQEWDVLETKSDLTFKAKQTSSEFEGRFHRFESTVYFDPDKLANSYVKTIIDVTSINTQYAERDDSLKSKAWFNTVDFPSAVFESSVFRKTGDNAYEADGTLTIRDISVPITLPFTLTFSTNESGKKSAEMDATVLLDRSRFGLGGKEWAGTDVIANEVTIVIHLLANAVTPEAPP